MKNNKPQCKDIPDRPILEFLAGMPFENGFRIWCNWHVDSDGAAPDNSVVNAFPIWAKNEKLILAKMRQLIRRKFVDGCCCGCRGDFVITDKGLEYLEG